MIARTFLVFIYSAICFTAYTQGNLKDSAIHHLSKLEANLKAPANETIILLKITGEANHVRVTDGPPWPDKIETAFVVIKNTKGKIIYASEAPMSERKEWNLQMAYHFD